MATLALSFAGAALGKAIGVGASVGWLAGSLLANWLFAKGSKTEGPRLTDLQVQTASEGTPIPVVYGGMRVAGQMFWTSGLLETKVKKKVGGKGMGGSSSHTTYTYRASFAIGLCEGEVHSVRKIWADSKLIYDASSTDGATLYLSHKKLATLAIYSGSETQTPDPTIQAYEGAANTPAYRGTAYIVFTDLQLADFANRIPNITAEVIVAGTGTRPRRLNTWATTVSARRVMPTAGGLLEETSISNVSGDGVFTYRIRNWDGTLVSEQVKKFTPINASAEYHSVSGYPRLKATSYPFVTPYCRWILDGVVGGPISVGPYGNYDYRAVRQSLVYIDGYVFSLLGGTTNDVSSSVFVRTGILRYPTSNGIPQEMPDKFYDLIEAGYNVSTSINLGTLNAGNDGLLYFCRNAATSPNMIAFDTELNVVATYDWPTTPGHEYSSPYVAVWNGYLIDRDIDGGIVSGTRLYQLTEPTLTFINSIGLGGITDPIVQGLGSGLVMTGNGIVSMLPGITVSNVTLESIVNDICDRSGLTNGQYNATQLTDIVPGYVIPRQMTGRAAIEQLRTAYFFDVVETDGVIKFVKRGGASVVTLTEDDYQPVSEFGPADAEALVQCNRIQELELPVEVIVQYFDKDNDYQPGSQSYRRLATDSKHVVTVELAIAMSSTTAIQIAAVLARTAWLERESFKFTLQPKHRRLDPADIITLHDGRICRLVDVNYLPMGAVECEAVADLVAGYTSVEVGNDSDQNNPQTLSPVGPTKLVIMDIPPLRPTDNAPGYYLAMCGYVTAWNGAELSWSVDGSVWESVVATTEEATIGHATTALAAPMDTFGIDLGPGVTVSLVTPGATLSSSTVDNIIANAATNLALLGNELIQFATATLNGDGTYTLSGLLRARFNTEHAIGTHIPGEPFVLIRNDGSVLWEDITPGNLNIPIFFRAQTFSEFADDLVPSQVTIVGNSVIPPAPIHLAAGQNSGTGDWTLSWVRQGKIDFHWWNAREVPADEDTEQYEVDILDEGGNVVRTLTATNATSVTYTAAQQLTDFNSYQHTIRWLVYKIGDVSGRGRASEQVTSKLPTQGIYSELVRQCRPVMYVHSFDNASSIDDLYGVLPNGSWSGTKTVNIADRPIYGFTSGNFTVEFTGGRGIFANHPTLQITQAITIEVWLKWTSSNSNRRIIGKWDPAADADKSYLLTTGSGGGNIEFYWRTANGQSTIASGSGFNDGNWHYIVARRIGAISSLWIDGVQRASGSAGQSADLNVNTTNLILGANPDGTNNFLGYMHKPAIYNMFMSDEQILARWAKRVAAQFT